MSAHSDFIREKIIIPSYELIKEDTKLKRFYFIPGLVSILFLTGLLVYQVIYTYIILFENEEIVLEQFLYFFQSSYFLPVSIVGVIFFLFYVVMMPIFEGGLLKYIQKRDQSPQEKISTVDSMGAGLYRFTALFEYNNIFSQFKLTTILNAYLFGIRFLGLEYLGFVSVLFFFVFLFSFVFNLLTNYATFEIILDGKKAFPALGGSIQLSVLNPKTTIKLYLFMFILNIRVIINFIVFLLFPILIITAVSYIGSQLFLFVTLLFLGGVFAWLTVLLGYLNGVLDVFKNAIWYHAYLQGSIRRDEEKD